MVLLSTSLTLLQIALAVVTHQQSHLQQSDVPTMVPTSGVPLGPGNGISGDCGRNNVCLPPYSAIRDGANNSSLEQEILDRGTENTKITGGGSTITGGYRNYITNQYEYSTVVGDTGNIVKGPGATIGVGAKSAIIPVAEFGTIFGGKENTTKAVGATIYAGTTNQTLADISSIGRGENNNSKAESNNATLPGGRGNTAKGDGSIVLGHNGKVNHNNAMVVNIPLQSGKTSLQSTSAMEFLAAADRFIFQIENTRVVITKDKVRRINAALNPPDEERRRTTAELQEFRPASADHVTADRIRALIEEKEAILDAQENTISKFLKTVNRLTDEQDEHDEEQQHTTRTPQYGSGSNRAIGSLSMVNGGDFLIRSEFIELRTGRNKDGTPKGTLILNKDNIVQFKRLVQGATRRREEAQTHEESELLDELEDMEDTIDENIGQIDDLQHTIRDLLTSRRIIERSHTVETSKSDYKVPIIITKAAIMRDTTLHSLQRHLHALQ